MILGEMGCFEDDEFTSPPQTKAQWIASIASTVSSSMPNVIGGFWWHENGGTGGGLEFYVDSSPAAEAAWATLASTWTGRPPVIEGVTQALANPVPYVFMDYGSGTGSGNSFTCPVNKTGGKTAGDLACLAIGMSNPGITVTSVTDTQGNVYTIDNAHGSDKPVAFAFSNG